MIATIHKGKHRARPIRLGFFFDRDFFRWKILFTPSCRYYLQTGDQLDTNKLIGVGYLPGHHKHSARFGWCYNATTDLIELSAYCYVDGKRIIKRITDCEIGKEYRIELQITRWSYIFSSMIAGNLGLVDQVKIDHNHKKHFKYRLGTFFGGNMTAPHEIKIQIQRA